MHGLLISTGKTPGRQAHLQYELGENSDEEGDVYDDKLRGEDYAAGLMFMNPFAAHQVFESEIDRGMTNSSNSVDVRSYKGKLHVPLDGAELELSKRKIEADKKTITSRPKIPFFASERTRIRALIEWKEQQAEEEERDKIQKLKEQQSIVRAARKREQQERAELERIEIHNLMRAASERAWNEPGVIPSRGADGPASSSLSAGQVDMTSYWGQYNGHSSSVRGRGEERKLSTPLLAASFNMTQSDRGQPSTPAAAQVSSSSSPQRISLVEIAMQSNSVQIRQLAAELQQLQVLVLAKKARNMLKETSTM
jgi:hypothetical protein